MGEKLPLVTVPTGAPPASTVGTVARWLAALGHETRAAGAGPRGPLRFEGGAPRKSPLSHPTTQPSPAWSGVMPGPSSWPCSGSPASRRRVSRAPSPAGATPASEHGVPEARRPPRRARRTRRRPRRCSRSRPPRSRRPRQSKRRHAEAAHRGGLRGDRGQPAARPRVPARRSPPGSAVTSSPPRAARTRRGVRGVGHHVEPLVVDPPHDDVVDDRSVVRPAGGCTGPGPGAILPQVVGEGAAAGGRRRPALDAHGPRWLTSKATAPVRQARCSATVPVG